MANLKNKMSKGNGDLNSKVPCKTKFTSLHYQKGKELRFSKLNSLIQQLFTKWLCCIATVLVAGDIATKWTK